MSLTPILTKTMSRLFLFFFILTFFNASLFAKNILVIGDSHSCGSFGRTLSQELTANGNQVDVFCTVSSSPTHWLKRTNPPGQICQTWSSGQSAKPCREAGKIPSLEEILSQKKYDSAVIALGTNSLYSEKVDATYAELAQKIKEKIKTCLWIGPPHLRPDQAKGFSAQNLTKFENNLPQFYKSLEKAVQSQCHLLSSFDITAAHHPANETTDGVHRGQTAGAEWGKEISQLIDQSAAKNPSPATPTELPK